ncbi:MATE family efflux transporter [Eubacteriales bacterium OttesenSCG-928-K08]|nr:MATE family efflux transporter [Eubacteriales bacterium OttesenSCG-928-K08]
MNSEIGGTKEKLTLFKYLKVAVPFILATITQPLMGVVNTAVAGRLANPATIAGVSVGAVIFNTMYWLLGFLRVSTTGFTAQAETLENDKEKAAVLYRPLLIAVLLGLLFVLLQKPIFSASMLIINPDADVQMYTAQYYDILIYGAPAVLINYVILGWLMGRARTILAMIMQVSSNLLNIALDFIMVFVFELGVPGIAIATLISQLLSLVLGVIFMLITKDFKLPPLKEIMEKKAFIHMLVVDLDLIGRTLCLLVQVNVFTAISASFGTIALSANSILLQMKDLLTYPFEGLGNSASIFAGKATGNHDHELLEQTIKVTLKSAVFTALLLSTVWFFFGNEILSLFTDNADVLFAAREYRTWVTFFPIAAGFGMSIFGVFSGTSQTKPIRNSAIVALGVFLAVAYSSSGNNGLWLAVTLYYLIISVWQVIRSRSITRKL